MNGTIAPQDKKTKKLQVKEAVTFAIENIPEADQVTLEKFLAVVNTTGTFGEMTCDQLRAKMQFTLKYIPNACPRSLLIIAELLDIPMTPPQTVGLPNSLALLPAAQAEFVILNAGSDFN